MIVNRKHTTGQIRATTRLGFTLIEMLLVVAIISILATLSLVVLRGAQEDARSARTQSIISRAREVLIDKIERLETRTMPFNIDAVISGSNLSQKQYLRKRMLMEWLRAEIPSYYEDLEYFPSLSSRNPDTSVLNDRPQYWPDDMLNGFWASQFTQAVAFRPPAALLGIRRGLRMQPGATPPDQWDHFDGDWLPAPPFIPLTRNTELRNDPAVIADPNRFRASLIEGAECLYAILYNTWYNDQRGTHFLGPTEVGDLDGDGRPEVLDAWGEPMYFLVRRTVESLEVDLNGDNVIDDTDRDINGDSVVDHEDLLIDPSHPVTMSDIVIEIFSTRSNQF